MEIVSDEERNLNYQEGFSLKVRNKREAEFETENAQPNPHLDEVKSLWDEWMKTMVEGGKKFLKKIAQTFDKATDREATNSGN